MPEPFSPDIYLDNNATTPVAPEVLEAMLPYLSAEYGNPSSIHNRGRAAREAVDTARQQVAGLLGVRPTELLFTAGATESINTVLRSLRYLLPEKRHLVVTAVEHPAVLETVAFLAEHDGYEVTVLPVGTDGSLDLAAFRAAIRPDTAMAAVMWANNETGVLFPIAEIAEIAANERCLLHVDAVQAVGRIPMEVRALPIHFLSLSGHKLHGPKGCGALYVRRGAPFLPLLTGGGQERQRRSGTEAVPAIVGLGAAAELALHFVSSDGPASGAALRDWFESEVLALFPSALVNGAAQPRVWNTSNIAFEHCSGEAMLQLLDEYGISVSTSSACASNETEPSHVLRAMYTPVTHIHGTLRFSLSRSTSREQLGEVLSRLPGVVAKGMAASTYDEQNRVDDFVR